jgi:cytochrome P450
VLIDLAIHPEWKEKCKKEIQGLITRYAPSTGTLHEKLAAIPLSAWEDELPIFDACIRESQRIALSGVAIRRNVRGEIKIGEQVVKRGDFLAYHLGDVHLNSEYYPDPYKYDPGRWLRPDPVPNAVYPFLGWGAGRHPCVGMKVAKLEMKLISAMFLTRYEFDLVDKDGKFPNPIPVPDRNDIHMVRAGSWIRPPTWMLIFSRFAPLELRPTSPLRRLSSRQEATPNTLADSLLIVFIPIRGSRPGGRISY